MVLIWRKWRFIHVHVRNLWQWDGKTLFEHAFICQNWCCQNAICGIHTPVDGRNLNHRSHLPIKCRQTEGLTGCLYCIPSDLEKVSGVAWPLLEKDVYLLITFSEAPFIVLCESLHLPQLLGCDPIVLQQQGWQRNTLPQYSGGYRRYPAPRISSSNSDLSGTTNINFLQIQAGIYRAVLLYIEPRGTQVWELHRYVCDRHNTNPMTGSHHNNRAFIE